ncbi:hypothetical protein JCM14722_25460 [Pseudodesulfovibrio portus]|uniref:Uncharacterized protein n=1 Tax=Pseudodesulfovibrio portus TaxID=231439 RepID=A0ABM8AU26_9BACT|nr:hypothetical protein JCM14722_25460 [Pseudodesulfovibrio portus]
MTVSTMLRVSLSYEVVFSGCMAYSRWDRSRRLRDNADTGPYNPMSKPCAIAGKYVPVANSATGAST